MALDRDTALAILVEAKADGWLDDDIPESDSEIIEFGEHVYSEASRMFHEQNVRNNTIQKIIFIGDSPISIQQTDGTRPPVTETKRQDAASLVENEKLPVPAHIEGDASPMPRDLSSATDRDIRRLSGEYNAFLARATWLLSSETANLMNAEHLLNAEKSRALRTMNTIDPKTDKAKLAKVIDAEIVADPEVSKLMDSVVEHEKNVAVLKGLKEIYSGNVSVLSREWTMRHNEWERSR